jgi:hypothetical protein
MCATNRYGVDIVLPVCVRMGNISSNTVTAILIQVKNVECFGCNIDGMLFDSMDPFWVGLFSDSDDQSLRPVIRVVFALASSKAGISFPTIRWHNHADWFTAFDIWCAGLSTDTSSDDLMPYRLLLERSLQPHDAFKLKEIDDPRLDGLTRVARGSQRRMMAPLMMSDIGHN